MKPHAQHSEQMKPQDYTGHFPVCYMHPFVFQNHHHFSPSSGPNIVRGRDTHVCSFALCH